MSVYKVIGKRRYFGFEPGETFAAELDQAVEERAVGRGDLEILEREDMALDPARITLPAHLHERTTR